MAPSAIATVEAKGFTLADLLRPRFPEGFGRTDGIVAEGLHGETMFRSQVVRIKVRETGPKTTRHRFVHVTRTGYDGEISATEYADERAAQAAHWDVLDALS